MVDRDQVRPGVGARHRARHQARCLAPRVVLLIASHRLEAVITTADSRLAVTLEIYTHEDRQAQHVALDKVSAALGHDERHKDDQK